MIQKMVQVKHIEGCKATVRLNAWLRKKEVEDIIDIKHTVVTFQGKDIGEGEYWDCYVVVYKGRVGDE